MKTLRIDIETYSPVPIKNSGVYPYALHPEFEILLFAYAYDNEPVDCIDLASGQKMPEWLLRDLSDPTILKTAFNALFERICISAYFKINLPINQWECTMIKSAMLGLPMSLSKVAEVLKLDQQKSKWGGALIRYFCVPCKPTKANSMRVRNMPADDPNKWEQFIKYCIQDVNTERSIGNKISFFEIPATEKALYILDQEINDRGVLVDPEFVNNAIAIDFASREALVKRAIELTGLDNPNSGAQLKAWLEAEMGEEVKDLKKASIPDMLKNTSSEIVAEVLGIRQELSKTSVKKYQAMVNAIGEDFRIRGLFQFYGANRTGRWAGRLVQLQNLPQNHLSDLNLARNLVLAKDGDGIEMLFGNVPDTLSQLIRTAFISEPGELFFVADFSAIEARVIAWLAGEKWRLEVFATHGKIYEASAAQMFKVPMDSIGKGSPLRQKGKIAELALGYQGGTGALETMGALKMGLKKEELQPIVDLWRQANPAIVRLWAEMNDAMFQALEEGGKVPVTKFGVSFEFKNNALYMNLPSGRKLSYLRPKIGQNRFGGRSITYEGMDQTTKQWKVLETYGGKCVENMVQAIARDCLAHSMLRLDAEGYDIAFHVHDEVIIEYSKENPDETIKNVCAIMGEKIPWAPGLLLKAAGYYTPYYLKD